jgi:hypothetical protein
LFWHHPVLALTAHSHWQRLLAGTLTTPHPARPPPPPRAAVVCWECPPPLCAQDLVPPPPGTKNRVLFKSYPLQPLCSIAYTRNGGSILTEGRQRAVDSFPSAKRPRAQSGGNSSTYIWDHGHDVPLTWDGVPRPHRPGMVSKRTKTKFVCTEQTCDRLTLTLYSVASGNDAPRTATSLCHELHKCPRTGTSSWGVFLAQLLDRAPARHKESAAWIRAPKARYSGNPLPSHRHRRVAAARSPARRLHHQPFVLTSH